MTESSSAARRAPAAPRLPQPHDEMVTGDGAIRPHWQALIGALRALPPAAIAERLERARRQFVDNGVTYNVFSDPRGLGRPWSFDLIPLPLPAAEWAALEAGLTQRARLLDAILADLYGPQLLLHRRWYPPGLVHTSPGFLRPLVGVRPARGAAWLHLYATDLMRGADGVWRVINDRVQAPSGAGYAFENRNVMARILPEAFRACGVRRLSAFFDRWQAALAAAAPRHRDNPRIVLLTPGPYAETYFEHVYLARQLGLTLAEGGDLTVREEQVFLKTLAGLQPVDVVLRRLDDDFCDPLELRSDSALGVAGLVQAVRAGNVVVANALGSSLLETPALGAFLPNLCRQLLGEELRIPSVATWWLGQRGVMADLDRQLDRLIVKRVTAAARAEPLFGAELDRAQRDALRAEIAARPQDFVVQERLVPSATPVWTPQGLVPHPMVLRVYLVAQDGGYAAMPGGLTRVAPDPDGLVASMQRGGLSKDTWVLAEDGAEPAVPARAAPAPVTIRRSSAELPSRVADDLFWIGRYAERLDDSLRVLRAALTRLAGGGLGPREYVELGILGRVLAARSLIAPQLAASVDQRVLADALAAACAPDGVLDQLFRGLQRIAPAVRDRLSGDMWTALSQLMQDARTRLQAPRDDLDSLLEAIDHAIGLVAAFAGMASENMTRGGGWRFLDLGRRLERGLYVVAVARSLFAGPGAGGEAALRLALELCDSAITYRARYLAALQPAPVLDLILVDESNPRALAYQLATLAEHLDRLPEHLGRPFSQPEQKLAHAALSAIRLADVDIEQEGGLGRLQALIEDANAKLLGLSDAVTRTYFSHIKAARAVGYAGAPGE